MDGRRWPDLQEILEKSHGGSWGIAGARGSGKTWLMKHAISWANQNGGMGVWFPSSSEYDPEAFLRAISDIVALRFEQFYDKKKRRHTSGSNAEFVALVTLAALACALLFVVWRMLAGMTLGAAAEPVVAVGLILAPVSLLIVVVRRIRSGYGLGEVRQRAKELRENARWATSVRETKEVQGQAGTSIIGTFTRRWALDRAERPATLSSWIHSFREFAQLLGERLLPGPLVIVVDELDKISDDETLMRLLRDIKGIFDIPMVHFLVSISDEAARERGLGTIRTRNEFHSSFDNVLHLKSMKPENYVKALRLRDPEIRQDVCHALGAMAGGNPRECIRLADVARRLAENLEDLAPSAAAPTLDIKLALTAVAREELDAFRSEVLTASARYRHRETQAIEESDKAKLDVILGWGTRPQVHDIFPDPAADLIHLHWHARQFSAGWRDLFGEEWKRLNVRLYVAGLILERPQLLDDEHGLLFLQNVITTAAASSEASLQMLKRRGPVSQSVNAQRLSSPFRVHCLDRMIRGGRERRLIGPKYVHRA